MFLRDIETRGLFVFQGELFQVVEYVASKDNVDCERVGLLGAEGYLKTHTTNYRAMFRGHIPLKIGGSLLLETE